MQKYLDYVREFQENNDLWVQFINNQLKSHLENNSEDQTEIEIKEIPWYEWLYLASSLWHIVSLKSWRRKNRIRLLKPQNDKWYKKVSLFKSGKKKFYKIHRLILLTFIWPSNLLCNHINWIKDDNRLSNLEYCTKSENELHAYRTLNKKSHFSWKLWKLNHNSKKIWQYSMGYKLIKVRDSSADIQRELWFWRWNISSCCNWKQKTSKWYIRSFNLNLHPWQ